jgi:hypothetical protein
MSPEVCIEPGSLVVALVDVELMSDVVLSEGAYGEGDGVADCCFELGCEALELVMGRDVDSNARTLHANQHTRLIVPPVTQNTSAERRPTPPKSAEQNDASGAAVAGAVVIAVRRGGAE